MKLDTLMNYGSGDLNFVKDTIKLFVKESAVTLSKLQIACKERDWQEVNRLSHSLKPNYTTFELDHLRNLAYQIEQKAENYTGNAKDLSKMIIQLSDQTKQVYPMLKRELTRLK